MKAATKDGAPIETQVDVKELPTLPDTGGDLAVAEINSPTQPIIQLRQVVKVYTTGAGDFTAINNPPLANSARGQELATAKHFRDKEIDKWRGPASYDANAPDPRAPQDSAATEVYYRVQVTDEGTGMSEEVMRHIFEPFFTTKEQGEGTGLGLSVSYGIVQDHRGWIDVESKIGEGTRFSVYIPKELS